MAQEPHKSPENGHANGEPAEANSEVAHRRRPSLDRLRQQLDALPILPVVVVELLRLDPKMETYFERIATLVSRDPGFATQVLARANSAASRPLATITRVKDAVARVGSQEVANLVIASGVTRIFVPREAWARELWAHALQVAEVARAVAPAGVDPESLYLAGLLHDVGRFVLYVEAHEDVRAIYERRWRSPDDLSRAEEAACGFSHAELGYQVALKWRLPDWLATVIRTHHHDPTRLSGPVAARLLVDHLRLADAVAMGVGTRNAFFTLDNEAMRERLVDLRLRERAYFSDRVLDAIRGALNRADDGLTQLGIG